MTEPQVLIDALCELFGGARADRREPADLVTSLLDTLWLAERGHVELPMPDRTAKDPAVDASGWPSSRDPMRVVEPAVDSAASTPIDTHVRGDGSDDESLLYVAVRRGAGRALSANRSTFVAGAPPLGRHLELERAFSVLRTRRATSRSGAELDIDRTIDYFAVTRRVRPQWKPKQGRWLDLVVVIERSPTMRFWQASAKSFVAVAARGVGALSTTTLFLERLRVADANGPLRLSDPAGRSRRYCARPCRQLVLYVSDTLGPGWMTGEIPERLARWATASPVLVLHVLPQGFWARTSLARVLPLDRWRQRAGMCAVDRPPPVPLLSYLGIATIGEAVAALAGNSGACAIRLYDGERDAAGESGTVTRKFRSVDPETLERATSAPPTPSEKEIEELWDEFESAASPATKKLARYLAAAPLVMPVMRLIERALVPEAAPWQLAELVMSGLIRRWSGCASSDPEDMEYEFLPGVRELLQEQVGPGELSAVIDVITQYVERRFSHGRAFKAYCDGEDPDTGPFEGDREFAPFLRTAVRVGASVLRTGERRSPPPGGAPRSRDRAAPARREHEPDRLRWLPDEPALSAYYVDHHGRLDRLRADVRRHPMVVLHGLAGTGKTALAMALAQELRGSGEDVVFFDIGRHSTLGPLRQTLGLLVREQPFDDDASLFAELRGRRWTLILDNVDDVLLGDALRDELLQLLAKLRKSGPDFRAIVITRRALAPATFDLQTTLVHELRPLDADEARRLFVAIAGRRLPPEHAVPDVLDPLLNELDGVPRSIALLAGQLDDSVDVQELRHRLAQISAEAASTSAVDNRLDESSLASALQLSLAAAVAQAPQAADLLDALGTLPGGLIPELLPFSQFEGLGDALSALLDHHLVHLVGDDRRITMVGPVRDWAARRWKSNEGRADGSVAVLDAIHRKLVAYTDDLADSIGTDRAQEARLKFQLEADNLTQLIAVRIDARDMSVDDIVVVTSFRNLSWFAEHGGDEDAVLRTLEPLAMNLCARFPDSWVTEAALLSIGRLRSRTNDLMGAMRAYEQALPICEDIGDRVGEYHALSALGDLKRRSGDLAGARRAYEQALSIYREFDDRLGEADTLQSLGDLKLHTNDLGGVRPSHEQALSIYREIEDRLGEAKTLRALGDMKLRADDLTGARRAYEQALPIYREIEDRLGEANTLRSLGDVKLRIDDLAGARQAYERALPIYRKIESRLGEANTLHSIGDLKLRIGDLAGANQAYEQALRIYREMNDRLGEANTLRALEANDGRRS